MKEVTVILTCEITYVETLDDEDAEFLEEHKKEFEEGICEQLKDDSGAADVKILKNQIFIRD